MVAFLGGMVVEGRVNARASLMASENLGIGAVDDRSQLWLGGLRILGPSINLWPAMAATVLVEEAREEAAVQAEVGRRVLPVFCQVVSGVVPLKSYWGR